MQQKLKEFLNVLHEKGIPLPLLRNKNEPSVSLTLLFLSSIHVQAALLNNLFKFLNGVDVNNALIWFGMCASLYFGRSFSNKNGTITDGPVKEESK